MHGAATLPPVRWRAAAVFAVLFAVYATTIGFDALGRSDYAGDEPHYLLTAESLVGDGDVDLTDEYREQAYLDWYPYVLEVHGRRTTSRQAPSARAITICWTSSVPSPIVRIFASR